MVCILYSECSFMNTDYVNLIDTDNCAPFIGAIRGKSTYFIVVFSVLSLNLHFVLPLLTLWHKSNWVSLWEAAVAHAVFVNLRPTEEVVSLYKQAYYTKTRKLWIECLKAKLVFVHFEVVRIILPLTFVLLLNWGT